MFTEAYQRQTCETGPPCCVEGAAREGAPVAAVLVEDGAGPFLHNFLGDAPVGRLLIWQLGQEHDDMPCSRQAPQLPSDMQLDLSKICKYFYKGPLTVITPVFNINASA